MVQIMPVLHRIIDMRQVHEYPDSYHIQGIDWIKMADDHEVKKEKQRV